MLSVGEGDIYKLPQQQDEADINVALLRHPLEEAVVSVRVESQDWSRPVVS